MGIQLIAHSNGGAQNRIGKVSVMCQNPAPVWPKRMSAEKKTVSVHLCTGSQAERAMNQTDPAGGIL